MYKYTTVYFYMGIYVSLCIPIFVQEPIHVYQFSMFDFSDQFIRLASEVSNE